MKSVKFAGIFAVLAFALTAVSANAAFTRDLTIGSTGADVIELQTWLEAKGFLTIPAGTSKGYFGTLTQSALAKYQVSAGIAPAAGYFGPVTRAKIAAAGTTTPGTGSNTGSDLSGGEASLEKFDLSGGDDSDVEEGNDGDIAEIEFDVEDGDINLDRIDLQLVADSGNDEKDPWDTFESLTLSVDGKEIADADLSDRDAYLDEDEGTIRISNINHKFDEGDTAKIVVTVTAQNSVDGADTNAADWTINVLDDGIRATDAEGIQQYVGADTDTVDFSVVEKGDGETLKVKTSSENPDADTLKVEDNKKSEKHAIFAFEIKAEEEDIDLDQVTLELTSGTAALQNVVSDLILEIDGEEFDDWSFTSGTSTMKTRTVTFDIDGDYTQDADSEATVVLWAEFKAANGTNFATTGETIKARVAADGAIEGEGQDDVDSEGVATGDTHSLATAGIIVPESSVDTTTSTEGDNDTTGVFTIKFEVTAFEEDFYIAENAAANATNGVKYVLEGAATTTATTSATLASTGDEDTNGVFTVKEGETETFTLTVTADVATTGQYRVAIDRIFSTENSNGTSGVVAKVVDQTKFRTGYKNINAN